MGFMLNHTSPEVVSDWMFHDPATNVLFVVENVRPALSDNAPVVAENCTYPALALAARRVNSCEFVPSPTNSRLSVMLTAISPASSPVGAELAVVLRLSLIFAMSRCYQ